MTENNQQPRPDQSSLGSPSLNLSNFAVLGGMEKQD